MGEAGDTFFQEPIRTEVDHRPPSPEAGVDGPSRIGRYPVLGRLGAGGMGVVLRVLDEEVGREIAVKILPGGADARLAEKFALEARVTGQLEHPNIPPLHELGRTADGLPYFTMKRIAGEDLEARLRRARARPAGGADRTDLIDSLQIFLKICDAIRFAHDRGVIHRDLKPANVMVGEFGEVYVMDWGLARVIGREETGPAGGGSTWQGSPHATLDGTILGTPSYMAPEQAEGRVSDVDPRTDVYALGAILYEMLALVPAYSGRDSRAIVDRVSRGDLVPPSRKAPHRAIPWELETVVLRAMATRRAERYPSVEALRDDVVRFLEGRTLEAARYSIAQLASKWVGQHKALVGSTAAILAIGAVLGAIAFTRIARSLERERAALESERSAHEGEREAREAEADARRAAQEELRRTRRALSDSHVLRSRDALRDRNAHAAAIHLARAAEIEDTALAHAAGFASIPVLATLERTIEVSTEPVEEFDLSPDGRTLALAIGRRIDRIDLESGVRDALAGHGANVRRVVFARGGRHLASADVAGTILVRSPPDGPPIARIEAGPGVHDVAISSDGRLVAAAIRTGDEGSVALWRVGEDRPIRTTGPFPHGAYAVAFSPDGRRVAAGGGSRAVLIHEVETGRLVRTLEGHSYWIESVAFDETGSLLASGSADRSARVWDLSTGRAVHVLEGHGGDVSSLAFGPGARALISAGADRAIRIWDVTDGGLAATLPAHDGIFLGARASADGRRVASLTAGGVLRLWRVEAGSRVRQRVPRVGAIHAIDVSPDGRLVAAANYYGPVDLIDVTDGGVARTFAAHEGTVLGVRFSLDGERLATGGRDGRTIVWLAATGRSVLELPRLGAPVTALAWSAEGASLAVAAEDGNIRLFDANRGQIEGVISAGSPVRSLVRSRDLLIVGCGDGAVRIHELATGVTRAPIVEGEGSIHSLALSPDAKILAVGTAKGVVAIRDVETGHRIATFREHAGRIEALAFDPGGRLLASSGPDRRVVLTATATWRRVWTLEGPTQTVQDLVFDPRGRFLAGAGSDQTVRLWGLDRPGSLEDAQRRAGQRLEGVGLASIEPDRFQPAPPAPAPWPVRVEDPLHRGLMFLWEKNHEPAIEWFERALRVDPRSGAAALGHGLALERVGRNEEAIRSLERALETLPPGQNRTIAEERLNALRGR